MIKISTLLNDASQVADNQKVEHLAPGPQAVKMLISYSQALQVIHCNDFKTCYIVLN
jgi:hypothetical protein